MSPNANGVSSNGNGAHTNGNCSLYNGSGTPAVPPKSAHANRWEGVERPYSQVWPNICVSQYNPILTVSFRIFLICAICE